MTLTYNINPGQISKLVQSNEVAWMERGSLIEFSGRQSDDCSENYADMLEAISAPSICKVFDRESDDSDGFEDLLDWSTEDDLLILVDDILFCVASSDAIALSSVE